MVKKSLIIGLVGFIGSGKDTAAAYLCDVHGFRHDSFANTLKDAVSNVFNWDRTLLEGKTPEAREWREQVDQWWANRLGIPNLTPRWILQHWGTEVLRIGFHDEIWIASLENRLRKSSNNIVISDVRFPNEMKAIKNAGGMIIRIKRGAEPEWYQAAVDANQGEKHLGWALGKHKLEQLGIHASETAWVGLPTDHIVTNDGSIYELHSQLEKVISQSLSI